MLVESTEFNTLIKRIKTAGVSSAALGWFYIILIPSFFILSRVYQYLRAILQLTLADVVLTLSISFILIVLGNRIKKQVDENTEKYLKILTLLMGIWMIIGIMFGSGVGIISLILLFYYVRALGAIKRLKQVDESVFKASPEYKIKKAHWIIFGIASILFFFVSLFLGPLIIPGEVSDSNLKGWTLLRSEEDGFGIMFPNAPQKETGVWFLETNGNDIEYHYTSYFSRQEDPNRQAERSAYAVEVIDYPLAVKDLDREVLLKEFLDDIVLRSSANKLISSKITDFNAYKALDFAYSYNNIFYTYGRIVAADNTLYRLTATYYKERYYSSEELNYFVNSFNLYQIELPTELPVQADSSIPIMLKTYAFEEITEDFNAVDFMDRRLVKIKENGEKEIIVPSMRILMGWKRVPGEAGFYPRGVSFPPYSSKIFFVKHMAGTGHSVGLFMLDTGTLEYKELPNSGGIYENYYNTLNILSPDGFRVASLYNDKLYLLDLLKDEVKVLVEVGASEEFNVGGMESDYKWLDDATIQYPVHVKGRPYEVRQVSI